MTLSSKRHDLIVNGTTVTLELVGEELRTWQLAVGGQVVDEVSTNADCVLTATLPKGDGDVRAVVQQHEDGTVKIQVLHEGRELATFNDAQEVE